ncbi:unnamed protein product, partial [Lymnaea stagnalis]
RKYFWSLFTLCSSLGVRTQQGSRKTVSRLTRKETELTFVLLTIVNMDPEEREIRLQAREVCELFKGRFKEEEMMMVIKEIGGKLPAVDFILKEDPEVVSQFLKKSKSYVTAMQEDSKKLSSHLDEWITIESGKRQFACEGCVRFWWKRVPIRKEVSRCRKCQVKYDAVPRENEWGLGAFYCLTENCGKEFLEYAVMNMSESMCFD